MIATTATLREGESKRKIFETLGIDPVQHHLIRRSNRRREIQIILREMQSAVGAAGFHELEWVLSSTRNTVIFCRTIGLVTKIAVHLFQAGIKRNLPDLDKRIRTFTAVNWASFNSKALESLNDNPYATITIATDVLSVGWDNRYIQDVIIYGEPDNIDDFVQKIGRAGRDGKEVTDPRAILYVSKNAKTTAVKVIAEHEASLSNPSFSRTSKFSNPSTNDLTMDVSIAKLILAPCYPLEIDTQYNNAQSESACSCERCHTIDPMLAPSESPVPCACSGCKPEDPSDYQVVVEKPAKKTRAKRGQGISKEMEAQGMKRFAILRREVFRDARQRKGFANVAFFSPQVFLPDSLAKALIKMVYSLDSQEKVEEAVKGTELEEYGQRVFEVCAELRDEFEGIRSARKAAKATEAAGVVDVDVVREESEGSGDDE